MSLKNTEFFICAHKDFDCPIVSQTYKILHCGNNELNNSYDLEVISDKDNPKDNISHLNEFYSELSGFYHLWKNRELKDYVGLCHYNRYFEFMDTVPDLSQIEQDIIVPSPFKFDTSIYEQYKTYHNIEDLDFCINYIKEKYNVSDEKINEIFHDNDILLQCNIFLTNKEIFNKYCEFFFDIIEAFLKHKNCVNNNMEEIIQMVKDNQDKYPHGNQTEDVIKYQCRIARFLSERLFTFFVIYNNLKVMIYPLLYEHDLPKVSYAKNGLKIING